MSRPHFLTPLLRRGEGTPGLYVAGRPEPVATALEAAFDSASRKRGLLGRPGLQSDAALIIAPSMAVHTFRMRFPIDLVFARRDGRIVKLQSAVRPNRMSAAWRAFAVIELAEGTIARCGLEVGNHLEIRPPKE